MNPFSGSSFTQQTLLIIASANIVFSLGDIRKYKDERGTVLHSRRRQPRERTRQILKFNVLYPTVENIQVLERGSQRRD